MKLQCDCITASCAPLQGAGDLICVDGNGLLKGPVYQFFGVKGYPQPLAGRGLVLGTDDEGDRVSPETTLEWLHPFFPEKPRRSGRGGRGVRALARSLFLRLTLYATRSIFER